MGSTVDEPEMLSDPSSELPFVSELLSLLQAAATSESASAPATTLAHPRTFRILRPSSSRPVGP
jgi:hypothetical protein